LCDRGADISLVGALAEQTGLSWAAAVRTLRRGFNSSPEVIRLTVMMYVRYPLSLRKVEICSSSVESNLCHETVRLWWHRFGPVFAPQIRFYSPDGDDAWTDSDTNAAILEATSTTVVWFASH
jgi:hypothetical protein